MSEIVIETAATTPARTGGFRSWLRGHAVPMRGVPRWVHWAAIVAALTPLPTTLWRLAMAVGVDLGFTGELAEMYHGPSWSLTPYVIMLSAFAEALAFLTIGLVKPWGEVAPRWIPFIGGKPVRPLAAIIPAALGAIALTSITLVGFLTWDSPDNMGDPEAPNGAKAVIMNMAYAPLLLWGPLLAIVTTAYAVRRFRK